MEKSSLRERILMEVDNLISHSCSNGEITEQSQYLHRVLLKKHYNAVGVNIDYHRKRVEMDIVIDDTDYDPKTVNIAVPTVHANMIFKNLKNFLQSCVDSDTKSLAFYAGLLRSLTKREVPLHAI
ncbi:MAG: hypothetical protein HKN89_01050 [Eudoraea sp.]|nr:hypothetical protein [Eudoraea sp.]